MRHNIVFITFIIGLFIMFTTQAFAMEAGGEITLNIPVRVSHMPLSATSLTVACALYGPAIKRETMGHITVPLRNAYNEFVHIHIHYYNIPNRYMCALKIHSGSGECGTACRPNPSIPDSLYVYGNFNTNSNTRPLRESRPIGIAHPGFFRRK